MPPVLKTHFAKRFLPGILIAFILAAASPQMPAQDDRGQQREQIGQCLGVPVYRDEISKEEGLSLVSELHRLFTSAAIREYREQHNDAITPTPTEIAAGTKYFDKRHIERMKEQQPALDAQLKAIEEKLAVDDLPEDEKETLLIQRRSIQMMKSPPGESFAIFALKNLKFQRHLYLKYGGGRVLFQQAGLESFDATRKWLASLEQAGKFAITDQQLRSELYHYYDTQNHGPFLSRDEKTVREIVAPEWLDNSILQE